MSVKGSGWRRLLAAAAVSMAVAGAVGAVAAHPSVPRTHAVASGGVLNGDAMQAYGIQGSGAMQAYGIEGSGAMQAYGIQGTGK
jgi:hypothetical protein